MEINIISIILAFILMIYFEKKGYIEKLENKIIDFLEKKNIIEINLVTETYKKIKIKRNKN